MYRDCIAPAIYSDSWATIDTDSEPGVRWTSFRVILQSIQNNDQGNPTIYSNNQLTLVSPFGYVPHLIRVILRSLQISYFSTDVFVLLFRSFCSHAEGTMNKVVDPLHGVSVSYYLFLCAPYIIYQGLFRFPN